MKHKTNHSDTLLDMHIMKSSANVVTSTARDELAVPE